MRTISFFALTLLVPTHSLHSMLAPAEEKSWGWEVFHMLDQIIDPLSYFTDEKAPKVCEEVMRFNPRHESPRRFTGDAQCLEDIKSAFRRARALLTSLETESMKTHDSKTELLRNAEERQRGYYSGSIKAVVLGFIEKATRKAQEDANTLRKQSKRNLEKSSNASPELYREEFPNEDRFPTYDTVVNVVLNSHPSIPTKMMNIIRKTWYDPLKYFTDEKSQIVCQAILHFNPMHPYHTAQWEFNNTLEFHKTLVHQVFERQYRLLNTIEYAVCNKRLDILVSLNPENPDNQIVMQNISAIYPAIARAVIAGCIAEAERIKEAEARIRHLKEQEQREREAQLTALTAAREAVGNQLSHHTSKIPADKSPIAGRLYHLASTYLKDSTVSTAKLTELAKQLNDMQVDFDIIIRASQLPAPPVPPKPSKTPSPTASVAETLALPATPPQIVGALPAPPIVDSTNEEETH